MVSSLVVEVILYPCTLWLEMSVRASTFNEKQKRNTSFLPRRPVKYTQSLYKQILQLTQDTEIFNYMLQDSINKHKDIVPY